MKTNLLLLTTLLTGLSAGLFYSWAVSVIPGTKKVSDLVYLESMQSINREIINPWFLVIFLGPIVLIILSGIGYYRAENIEVFGYLIATFLTYMVGTVGVTAFGNVPMNEALDTLQLSGLSLEQLKVIRLDYESKWNRLHSIRTVFSVVAFALLLLATKYQFSTQ